MSTNPDVHSPDAKDLFQIDVRGLKCPLPVLKTAKRMRDIPSGTRVLVLSTDPMAAIDLPNFCREEGHTFVEQTMVGEVSHYLIIKG